MSAPIAHVVAPQDLRGSIEGFPGLSGEASTHAATTDPAFGKRSDVRVVLVHNDIDRLRGDRRDEFRDGTVIEDEGHEEAVGAGIRIGNGARDAGTDRHVGDTKVLVATDEHHRGIDGVHGTARGSDPFDGMIRLVHRGSGPILDRQGGHACVDRQGDVPRDILRTVGKAVLEIRVDRQMGAGNEHPQVVEDGLQAEFPILLAGGPGRTRTCRGNCLEAKLGEPDRAAAVPGIEQEEEAARMEVAKDPPLLRRSGRRSVRHHQVLKSSSRRRCCPASSKFEGASQAVNAAEIRGHSGLIIENQAVSRLSPFTTMWWRKMPSKVKPNRHGRTGIITTGYRAEFTQFTNEVEPRQIEPEEVRQRAAKKPSFTAEGTVLYGILKSLTLTRSRIATQEQRAADRRLPKGARLIPLDEARKAFGNNVMPGEEEDKVKTRFRNAFISLSKGGVAFYHGVEETGFHVWLPELAADD